VSLPGPTLPQQPVSPAVGVAAVYSAAQPVMTFRNGGDCLLHIKNGGGSTLTVTLSHNPGSEESSDRQFTVAAGSEILIGPFPGPDFNPPTPDPNWPYGPQPALPAGRAYSDLCTLSFSTTASVTVACLGLPCGAYHEH